jgi:DNA repair photolyase
MPIVGTQVILCDVPCRADTYIGCSHRCTYCFAQRRGDDRNNNEIQIAETRSNIRRFIDGGRTLETCWIDFNLPIHLGGLSDPFQPVEAEHRVTYGCLEEFAETKYPVIISTKGRLVAEPDYLKLLSQCRAVVQLSMLCSGYDELEPGAPPFDERLDMAARLHALGNVRVNARLQPYMIDFYEDILKNIPRFAKAGVYGVTVEGYKAFVKDDPRMIRLGGDQVYPAHMLRPQFEKIKEEAHKHGLKFWCGENRLRALGDELCCCGCEGMEGFEVNKYNLNHLFFDDGELFGPQPTSAQLKDGSADCFTSLIQDTTGHYLTKPLSFVEAMMKCAETRRCHEIMGLIESVDQAELF